MSVTMICPNLSCRNTVVAPETARGKIVRCAHCKQLFMVPQRKSVKEGRAEDATRAEPPSPKPPAKTSNTS